MPVLCLDGCGSNRPNKALENLAILENLAGGLENLAIPRLRLVSLLVYYCRRNRTLYCQFDSINGHRS